MKDKISEWKEVHNIQFRKEKKVSQRGAEEKVEKVQHVAEPSQPN